MDVLEELGIPKKQIRETRVSGRYVVITHRCWLQKLVREGKISDFPIHFNLPEWPEHYTNSPEQPWTKAHFCIYQKYSHKVLPLPRSKNDQSEANQPLSYSQLLHFVSQSNHKHLWKTAYRKYSCDQPPGQSISHDSSYKKQEDLLANLTPYDTVLRETIIRMYDCKIVHVIDKEQSPPKFHSTHVNLYPATVAIETNSAFIVIHSDFVGNTLLDCVTYSPAILRQSYHKHLFLIYQLLSAVSNMHDRGLTLGPISLHDIFVTENLWLHILPHLNANLVALEQEVKPSFKIAPFLAEKYSPKDYCDLWCRGQLTNFDYLTVLNNLSGRRIGSPDFHHIMPWVTDFTLRNGMNWRDLSKSKFRLNKGDAQLELTYGAANAANEVPHHVSDVLSEITYFVYMARRTPKSVLCRHVRPIWVPAEYPASIQRLQVWTPDECIPAFFNDPTVFKSIHEDLPDLEVPSWASCPEDFVAKHREALESQFVSERLHFWIDLNFGFKLSGKAAIKAKNVCLSLVDDHQTLRQRGVVQLFAHPHPPKQINTAWTGKHPPRLHSQYEMRQRLTRSSEDLSIGRDSSSPGRRLASSPKQFQKQPQISEDSNSTTMERSTSYHVSVQRSSNMIVLPRDYNPVAKLAAVESAAIFLSQTFHRQNAAVQYPNVLNQTGLTEETTSYAFTNRIFTETYEASLREDLKRVNIPIRQGSTKQTGPLRNFKQIVQEQRSNDLQTIGCVILELLTADALRPLGSCAVQTFKQRLAAAKTMLETKADTIPGCILYTVRLLLQLDDNQNDRPAITSTGLPSPSAQQLLQPLMSNSFFPFPLTHNNVYTLLKALNQFDAAQKALDLQTFFECDGGKECVKYEVLDRNRTAFQRKISECKVWACAQIIDHGNLLNPIGYEQFPSVDILLAPIVELILNTDTSIMAAWYLFDSVAIALGPKRTREHLLDPILRLYDTEADVSTFERTDAPEIQFASSASFRSKKTVKLYHHSFLLRLIVRFGLSCFLENFVSALIEAVGGYKDADNVSAVHVHRNDQQRHIFRRSRSTRNFAYCPPELEISQDTISHTLVSSEGSDKTLSPSVDLKIQDLPQDDVEETLFDFENESEESGSRSKEIFKLIDSIDIKSVNSSVDLQLSHSQADEALEATSRLSFDGDDFEDNSPSPIVVASLKSPTIPIPLPPIRRSREVNSIGCEIGSKKSIDSCEFMPKESVPVLLKSMEPASTSLQSSTASKSSRSHRSNRISEMSAESLIWMSHRLGPVLTARHLTRNLLKMLTLCYMGHENLLPDPDPDNGSSTVLMTFSIADGRIVGDQNAAKVLDCLTSISALFGEQFILLQYFPHISELIALCRKRITPTLEGGLVSSLQLLKYLVPFLSDSTIMEQIHDIILRTILHPIIRLLESSRFTMPSGFLARSVLARKLLDTIYVLAVRIGPEMTREHLCVPALQRFFLIFDKAYGIAQHYKALDNDPAYFGNNESSPMRSFEDSHFEDIKRDGTGLKIPQLRDDRTSYYIPIRTMTGGSPGGMDPKEKALDEIRDVFCPSLAHASYLPFLKYLGEQIMSQTIINHLLVLNLCLEYQQPDYSTASTVGFGGESIVRDDITAHILSVPRESVYSNSFGTTVVGNRIEVPDEQAKSEIGPGELLDVVTFKLDNVNTSRHLKGNWLAYWEHEIGRPDKDVHFNLKQIKLQTFSGHTNSVRSILALDNENSFISASKDKTVKLWSLRSEGDGTKVSSCQFTYTNHRKSVHSLAFLESSRLTVSCDSSVHIWDPFVGAQVAQLDSPKYVPVSVVRTFAPPCSLILAGTAESSIKIIDSRTFGYVNEWKTTMSPAGPVRCIAVSPCGWIAVGLSSGQIIVLDGRTGLIMASWRATDGELLQLVAADNSKLISSSLDQNISVWNAVDGTLLFHLRGITEPNHCMTMNGNELITGTTANKIGIYASVSQESGCAKTKLRSEIFRGVLTSFAVLGLNRMLLVGSDAGGINLLC